MFVNDLRLGLHYNMVPAKDIPPGTGSSELITRLTAWVARNGGTRVWMPALAYADYAHAVTSLMNGKSRPKAELEKMREQVQNVE